MVKQIILGFILLSYNVYSQERSITHMDTLLREIISDCNKITGIKVKDVKEYNKDSVLAVFLGNSIMDNSFNAEMLNDFCTKNGFNFGYDTISKIPNRYIFRYYFGLVKNKNKKCKKKANLKFEHVLHIHEIGLKEYFLSESDWKAPFCELANTSRIGIIDLKFLNKIKSNYKSNKFIFRYPYYKLQFYNDWSYYNFKKRTEP